MQSDNGTIHGDRAQDLVSPTGSPRSPVQSMVPRRFDLYSVGVIIGIGIVRPIKCTNIHKRMANWAVLRCPVL